MPAVLAATAPLAKLEEFDAAPQYSFAYDVQDAVTGDSKAQYETRNGDIVRGSYSLIEADGTRRIVEYTADPINGFNAIVSREPVIAAVAAPLRPAALAPIAPASFGPALTPVNPAPSIPASGPDSDVEVVEARSSGLSTSARSATREQEVQRQQFQRLQEQQRQQQERQLQEQQRRSSRLQIQQQVQQQEQQQDRRQQQAAAPARTVIAGQEQQPTASARFIGLPAKAIATYPTYPYSAAYYSPFAYAAPLTGLAYSPATALA